MAPDPQHRTQEQSIKARKREIFEEEAVNAILDEVVASCDPVFCEVEGVFTVRGGVTARAVARHGSD